MDTNGTVTVTPTTSEATTPAPKTALKVFIHGLENAFHSVVTPEEKRAILEEAKADITPIIPTVLGKAIFEGLIFVLEATIKG